MKKGKILIHYVLSYFLIFGQINFSFAQDNPQPTPPAETCSNGYMYNENSKSCVHVKDMKMVDNKHRECMTYEEGSNERNDCVKNVEGFGEDKTAGIKAPGDDAKQSSLKGKKAVAGAAGLAAKTMGAQAALETVFNSWCGVEKASSSGDPSHCFSTYVGIISFVMSLYNDSKLNKDAKKQMSDAKDELYKLVEEQKKTKGKSYEMQIKLMTAYKNALDVSANIAGQRLDGYKQEMTSYLLIVVVGAVDIVRGVSSCPACDGALIACGVMNIAMAGVGIGFVSSLISKAEKAKKKYESESDKIEKVLKRYQDFFMKQNIDSQQLLADNSLKIDGAGAPISISANGDVQDANLDEVNPLSELDQAICAEKPDMECCSTKGKTCQKFSVFGASSLTLDGLGAEGLDSVLSSSNDIMDGNSGLSDEDKSLAIDNNMKRMKKIQEKVLDKISKNKHLSKSDLDKMNIDKAFKSYLKEKFGDENHKFGEGAPAATLGDTAIVEEKSLVDVDESSSKDKSKDAANSGAVAPIDLSKFKMDLDDLEDENALSKSGEYATNGTGVNGNGLGSNEEYIYNEEDIVNKPEVSIFNVITNRYNILRIKKQFGQRPPSR